MDRVYSEGDLIIVDDRIYRIDRYDHADDHFILWRLDGRNPSIRVRMPQAFLDAAIAGGAKHYTEAPAMLHVEVTLDVVVIETIPVPVPTWAPYQYSESGVSGNAPIMPIYERGEARGKSPALKHWRDSLGLADPADLLAGLPTEAFRWMTRLLQD